MIEAISIVLFLGFLAASIASLVGVVIGFSRKRWRLAIITGSATGVLFVLFVIAVNLSDFEETETDAAPAAPVAVQAASTPTAMPEPTSIPEPTVVPVPTAAPEPTPTPYPTLGIKSDKIQSDFELFYKKWGIEFRPTEVASGNSAVMGVTESKRTAVVLESVDGELVYALLQLQTGGFVLDDELEAIANSMFLLAELVVPEWDRHKWFQVGLDAAKLGGSANIDQVHDGKRIKFIYSDSPVVGLIMFLIEPESAALDQVEQVPAIKPEPTATAERKPYGLGFTRGFLVARLAEFGYVVTVEDFCPEQCTYVSTDINMEVAFWLHGPHSNIDKVRVQGNMITYSVDTGIAMAELLHVVMPESSDAVRSWLETDVLDSLDSASGDVIYETVVIDGKQVQAEMHRATGKFYLSIRPGE